MQTCKILQMNLGKQNNRIGPIRDKALERIKGHKEAKDIPNIHVVVGLAFCSKGRPILLILKRLI